MPAHLHPARLRCLAPALVGVILSLLSTDVCTWAGEVRIAPAPAGEALSKDYLVEVDAKPVPVYVAKVASADPARRWKAMDDKAHSADYFDTACFAYFDMTAPVKVNVTSPEKVESVRLLPSSLNLRPEISGSNVSFTIAEPRFVTLEVNGKRVNALHLFANPPETDVPHKNDPGVIYFGPGIHEVSQAVVSNNQTVYVAPGAVVRGVIRPDEPFGISSYSGLRTYSPTFVLKGDNIRFCGRGIVDGSFSTTHARHLLEVRGKNINIEGVILRDSSTWTIPIRRSEHVTVKNVKLLGYRANSDGIDICNSRDVVVDGCFIRTLDDLIVVKTDKGQGPASRITARNCVLWNEVAHALSIGAELREDVSDVTFTDCDVIHDMGREWTLRVFHSDSARISNVRFENLRIEESPRLISLWINKAVWSRDPERGHIDGVVFRNIRAAAKNPRIEMQGFDQTHAIENVRFENVMVNGKPLSSADTKTNAYVRQVEFRP